MSTIDTRAELDEIIESTGESRCYATIGDVCADVRSALGEHADEFDVEAIADEAYAWYRAYDPEAGVEYLHEQGFYQTVDTDGFWSIAEAHAL